MAEKDDRENEEKIINALAGKLSFLQKKEEREATVVETINHVLGKYAKMDEREKRALAKKVLSYGIIDEFMKDPEVEDIMINALSSIFIYHTKTKMVKTDKRFESLEDLNLFIKKLLLLAGKEKEELVNDIHLPEGGRGNIVRTAFGPQITIRRFKAQPMSIIDLVEVGTIDYKLAALFWLYTEGLGVKPANILIAGPPGSGKTTLLNAMFSFFAANERIVVIEDTYELNTETEENCARMEATRELSQQELVKNALRMRPDRIIIGEVRGREANDLMTAMNVGKICMGTIHASSAREAVMRLENEPMNVPREIVPLIDVFVVIKRFFVGGKVFRVVTEVSETGGIETKVLLENLCNYDVGQHKMIETHPSVIFRDKLAQAADMTPKEVMEEVDVRADVLLILQKKGVRSIRQISEFCKHYYEDADDALAKLGYSR